MLSHDQRHDSHAWYAVWTRSRHEQAVKHQLTQRNIETFLPTLRRWSRWKDRRQLVEWPLFSGYCFVRFNGVDTLPILRCAGVLSVVSFAGKPAPIADHEIESLRVLIQSTVPFDPCPIAREGAIVGVVSGPLRGITGRLLRKDARRATVVLSVDLLNQAARVEVDAVDIGLP